MAAQHQHDLQVAIHENEPFIVGGSLRGVLTGFAHL